MVLHVPTGEAIPDLPASALIKYILGNNDVVVRIPTSIIMHVLLNTRVHPVKVLTTFTIEPPSHTTCTMCSQVLFIFGRPPKFDSDVSRLRTKGF
jgi:hypothetical protein